jgi:tripartite-type tricarboxylate transporter receptor subunit TctC
MVLAAEEYDMSKSTQRNRMVILVAFAAALLLFVHQPAIGADTDFPNRPITLIVGFPAGGSAGVSAQIFAEGARKYLPKHQSIIINYKPGGAAAIAADYFLDKPADGYNLLWNASDLLLKIVLDGDKLPLKVEDFVPIGTMAFTPAVLMVPKTSPFMRMEDLVNYAKKNPGKLSIASTGVAGTTHLAGEAFQLKFGIKLNHVPFSGAGPGMPALLGGHVDCAPFTAGSAGTHLQPGGGARGLAVFANERMKAVPDVPTAKEQGYDIERGSWYYLAYRKGTPQSVVDILTDVFRKTAADPQVKEALIKIGFSPLNLGPDETAKMAKEEYELAKDIFKRTGLLK